MAYQKLQVGLGLEVIPTDGSDIPNPAGPSFSSAGTAGTGVTGTSLTLVDSAADFIAERIAPGMVIYNTVDGTVAVVTSITDANTLVAAVKSGSTWNTTSAYTIYHETTDGCVLYVGGVLGGTDTGLDLTVVTSSGSEVQLKKLLPGSFLPIQVRRVKETGTGGDNEETSIDVVAFW